MGKDLHYLVIKFFHERMEAHNKVLQYSELQDEMDILYEIVRTGNLPTLTVHVSDAYRYTLNDYYSKPASLTAGDFILIARPEAEYDEDITYIAKREKIGIGKIGKLLGALNLKGVWLYEEKNK
jgi:hypothetical protein